MVAHYLLGRGRNVMMKGRNILPNKYGGSVKMLDKELSFPIVGHAFRDVGIDAGRQMLGRDGLGQRGSGVASRKPLIFRK
jgi:hypothetical protein